LLRLREDFPTRGDWSTKYVDLVAPDGLVFFTEGSICKGRAGAGVFSDILNVLETYYALGCHPTVFQSEVSYSPRENRQKGRSLKKKFSDLNFFARLLA
jgi:hypothetical protein